jgi:hypothetical protein
MRTELGRADSQRLDALRRILKPEQTGNVRDDQDDEEGPSDDTSGRPAGNGGATGEQNRIYSVD